MNTPKGLLSTQQVLEKTLMSRFTLHRKQKSGEFPAPVRKKHPNNPSFWEPSAVDKWIDENACWVDHRERKKQRQVKEIRFTEQELITIEKACKLLDCEIEPFLRDAAYYKAKKVIEHSTSKILE